MTAGVALFEFEDGIDGGELLGAVVPRLGAVIAGVRPTDYNLSTPCGAWTMHDLLNHVVGGAAMFADAFEGAPLRDISGRLPDAIGDDPADAFNRGVERFGAALASPGAMERVLDLPFGAMTVQTFLRFVSFDLLVHTWDIATAAQIRIEVPDELVDGLEPFAHAVLAHHQRNDLSFAPPQEPPLGATGIERLVAFTGRRVG